MPARTLARGVIVATAAAVALAGCEPAGPERRGGPATDNEDKTMTTEADLENMLTTGDWRAVDAARELGEEAWPTIRRGAGMANYKSRQIAMACAAAVGGDPAGAVLGTALDDENVNVRTEAAKGLSVAPPQTARDALLDKLQTGRDDVVRGYLALGAGYLPSDRTTTVLRPLAKGGGELAQQARMALAKLGDAQAREALIQDVTGEDPEVRYRALGQLRYVNDPKLAAHARPLLADKRNAQRIGTNRNPQFRRVCDQAVDTLVHLLELTPKVKFETNVEKIYSPEELAAIADLAGK